MGGEQGADGWTGRFPSIEGGVCFVFKDGTVIGRDGKVGRESCVCFVYLFICLVVLFVFLFLLLFELNRIFLSVF